MNVFKLIFLFLLQVRTMTKLLYSMGYFKGKINYVAHTTIYRYI